jgi:hypothetical protein|tara:strand:- start:4155 stop:4355 length:201 start_codon:yes stop_codon:yes gene_type:complete
MKSRNNFKVEKVDSSWDFIITNPRYLRMGENGGRKIKVKMLQEDLHRLHIIMEETIPRLPRNIKHE